MIGFESQAVISKQLSLCLDVVLIVMAGFDSQVRFYVRLVLMREKPSVIKPKLNEVTGMENYTHRNHTKLELVMSKTGEIALDVVKVLKR
jgi:hypothetical protein